MYRWEEERVRDGIMNRTKASKDKHLSSTTAPSTFERSPSSIDLAFTPGGHQIGAWTKDC